MDDLGGRTEDLITLRRDHPAEPAHQKPGIPTREITNRRYGRTLLTGGAGTLVLTTLIVAIIPERVIDALPPLVTMTVIHLFLLLGTSGVLAALLEMLSRYNRHLARESLTEVAEMQEKLEVLIGLVSGIPGRLSAIEEVIERVPAYGEGVILGASLRGDSVAPETS